MSSGAHLESAAAGCGTSLETPVQGSANSVLGKLVRGGESEMTPIGDRRGSCERVAMTRRAIDGLSSTN